MHITSVVGGKIQDGKDPFDVIEAILPAGTLSGAPKIRACEIIGEVEKEPRGIYGGAIGYIDFSGNMDTCIAIRMAVKKITRFMYRQEQELWQTVYLRKNMKRVRIRQRQL